MKAYKLSLVAVFALAGLLAGANLSSAQEANQPKQGKQGEKRGPAIQERVDRMAEELKLTDEQKTKVKAVFEEQSKKQQELRSESTLTPEQRREKAQSMREEANKKMKGILTPEQYTKYEKRAAEMRKQGPGGPGGAGKDKAKAKE